MNEEEMATRDGCEKKDNDGGGCDIDAKKKIRKKESRGEEEEEWLTGWPQHKNSK